jgi:purine-binding chemotaxis protein CheW
MNDDGKELTLATEETFLRGLDAAPDRPRREILTMRVANELYGVDVPNVREIIKPRELTEVPRTPDFLLGIVSVRGVIVPCVDLRLRLKLEVKPATRDARIVIVDREGEPFGLYVDEVRSVLRIPLEDIEPPPSMLGSAEGHFLQAVGRYHDEDGGRDRVVILLELSSVLELGMRRRKPGELFNG